MTDQSNRAISIEESTHFIMDQKLWLKILIGMALGIITGLLLSPTEGYGLSLGLDAPHAIKSTAQWLSLPGTIFLSMIKMVIIPLIICSIILGIAQSNDMGFVGKIGATLIPYFIFTTAISIAIGITLANIIQPGAMIDSTIAQQAIDTSIQTKGLPTETFSELSIPERISNLIPSNPFKSSVNSDMLQLVVAAIITGLALIAIPSTTGKPIKELCIAGQVLAMKIISWAMLIAPYAVFGLLASTTLQFGFQAIESVGLYAATVLSGLLCMIIIYMLIIALAARSNPLTFLSNIREVQLLAFSTSSSGATMPFSIQAAEEKLKLRPQISRFIIPLGTTINMDGTALYQGVATIFLTQFYNIELSITQTVMLVITTIGASIGTPGVPGVGLVILATILTTVGVPPEGIALILGVDRILDMCRTTINVTGDLAAASVLNKWLK